MDQFQFGDIHKPGQYTKVKLNQMGITNAKELVRSYLAKRQPPAPGKVVPMVKEKEVKLV